MVIIDRFRIKHKLALMLSLPLIGLLYFAFDVIEEKAQLVKDMTELESLANLSIKVAEMVHQIQLERGLSSAFTKTNGTSFSKTLKNQYAYTDKARTVLEEFFEDFSDNKLLQAEKKEHNILATLEQIEKNRRLTQNLRMSDTQIINLYSNINKELIALVKDLTFSAKHKDIYNLKLALSHFLEAKDMAGLERSLLFSVLMQQYFEAEQFRKFIDLMARQHVLRRNIFSHFATSEQKNLFQTMRVTKTFTEVQAIRDYALQQGINANLTEVQPTQWFELQSKKIEGLKKIEDKIAQDLYQKANETKRQARTEFFLTLIIIMLLLVFTLLLVYFISHGMTKRLSYAVKVANAIAQGDLNNNIRVETVDETGQLLEAFKQMQQQLNERITKDKHIANEALRVSCALNNVSTGVMIADNEHNIIYLNKAIKAIFALHQEDIRKEMPHFDVDNIIGHSIDIFHTHPTHQHKKLEHLTNTHRRTIHIGSLIFDSMMNPVINEEEERLGTVVELTDRTIEVATEQEINTIVHNVSQGRFTQHINLQGKIGFFRTFSESINQIMELNESATNDMTKMFAAISQGDLTNKVEKDYTGTFEQLKNDANNTVDKLIEIATTIKQIAFSINNAAEEIAQGNANLNHRTEEQAASLQQTAASMEEMTGTVQQTADSTKEAHILANQAQQHADKGKVVVASAIEAMQEINDSSKRITEIIGVINDIAFQTNLLALNAAVEAARAGEQGRGFAVVATEVRNLAQRSATAAKEIKTLIKDSVQKVEEGTKSAQRSGKTLEEIVAAVEKVRHIIEEIAAASEEQSSGIQQVNKAITQMDSMTQQNASLVEEVSSSSESMRKQASVLTEQIAFFKIKGQDEIIPLSIEKTAEKTLALPSKLESHNVNEDNNHPYPYQDNEWEDF